MSGTHNSTQEPTPIPPDPAMAEGAVSLLNIASKMTIDAARMLGLPMDRAYVLLSVAIDTPEGDTRSAPAACGIRAPIGPDGMHQINEPLVGAMIAGLVDHLQTSATELRQRRAAREN